jgi:hypothetical protein
MNLTKEYYSLYKHKYHDLVLLKLKNGFKTKYKLLYV